MDLFHVANLEEQDLQKLRSLEEQLGVVLIAYSGDDEPMSEQ
ncbi:hypothetical protein [Bacillus solitudinis]|nr:hypothetical protein [Bacillus solitudinis]